MIDDGDSVSRPTPAATRMSRCAFCGLASCSHPFPVADDNRVADNRILIPAMSDDRDLISLRPADIPLGGLTDAEVVLLDLLLRSGLAIHPHRSTDADHAVSAVTTEARLRVAVTDALRHRQITDRIVAGRVVERALDALDG